MSIDMVDFARLTNDIGSEDAAELLDRFQADAVRAVDAFGGHVVDRAGDGLLAVFGAPKALENAALQACRAAVHFRHSMERNAAGYQQKFGFLPKFRAGIAGGTTTVVPDGSDGLKVVGAPVNEAARLQQQASPSQILISDAIRQEAGEAITLDDLGQVPVKGFAGPIQVFALLGADMEAHQLRSKSSRPLPRMLSRQEELSQALRVLEGQGPVRTVALIGPAGIGKSRLLAEIAAKKQADQPVIAAQCSQTQGHRTLGPIEDLLRASCATGQIQATRDALAALTGTDARAASDPAIQGDLQARALHLRDMALQGLLTVQAETGAILVVEDLHWIDAASAAILAGLAEHGLPMIVTARPEHQVPWLQSNITVQVGLKTLGADAVEQIIGTEFDDQPAAALVELIVRRSDGNPLLAKEFCRAARQSDALIKGPDGLELAKDVPLLLTGRLEHLVMGRVDRLAPDLQRQVQVAAALGYEVRDDILTKALGATSQMEAIAKTTDLMEPMGEGRWRFQHALVRDAVYASLLGQHRRQIHADIASALDNPAEASGAEMGQLAFHFEAAGNISKAVHHMVQTAKAQLEAYALEEVDRTCGQIHRYAVENPQDIDEQDFSDFAVVWLRALDNMGNFGRIHDIAHQLLPRLQAQGYSRALGIAQTITALALCHTRDYERSEQLALAAQEQAEDHDDALGAAWCKMAQMRIFDETNGRDRAFIEELAGSIAPVADANGDRHLAISARYLLSSSYRSSGQRTKALKIAAEIEDYARAQDDRRARIAGQWARALVYAIEGNTELAAQAIRGWQEHTIAGSADHSVCRVIEIYTRALTQPPDQVRDELVEALGFQQKMQDFNLISSLQWTQAVLEFRAGNFRLGWTLLNELIQRNTGEGNLIAVRQAYAMRAEVLLSLLGLVDPDAEAPPERPAFKRKKPGIGDILTAVRARIGAKSMARHDLNRCIDLDPLKYGANFARAQIGLGLIERSRGKIDLARNHLTQGLESARAEGLEQLIRRGEAALAQC